MFSFAPAYLLPLLIFVSRILDVSLGTIRIVMVARGFKLKAAFLGFFEVLIWAIVVSELLQNLDNWVNFIAYAGGFATGNYIGITIEEKLKVGTIIARIITPNRESDLTESIKNAGFTFTQIDAKGGLGKPVIILFTVLKRKRWPELTALIETHDPKAFYSSEDVKFATSEGMLSDLDKNRSATSRLLGLRKGF